MKIYFISEDHNKIIMEEDNGNATVSPFPPIDKAVIKIVEEYGGEYEIGRSTVERDREAERQAEIWEKFEVFEGAYIADMTIQRLMNCDLSKNDLMQLKMSMFKEDCVKMCTDKDMLSNLRKTEDPVDLVMYYGIIRKSVS